MKHINSPMKLVPNLIGKPFSWYNEPEPDAVTVVQSCKEEQDAVAQLYMGGETAGLNDSTIEPDMEGVEENVDTKADQMHDGRGRVRTSSQVFNKMSSDD